LRGDYGYDIPTASKATKRVPCSACGMSKRHLFDKAALDGGYTVLVTGHNLDDEAAVLLGNTMRWEIDYLARQLPVLPARDGFPKKVKPLVRLSERETAAWCIIRGIDYLVDECPMAAGEPPPRVQGDAQLDGADVARRQGGVLPQLHRQDGAAARRARTRRA
jgi:tRNA(Ile)-lysidine synthase TilS/MesJ